MGRNDRIYLIDLLLGTRKAFFYLLLKWWIFLIVCIIGGLLGISYAWFKEPVYTAELIFSSEAGGDMALGGYAGLAAQFGIDMGGGKGGAFEGDNLMELLRSRSIIQKTLLSKADNLPGKPLMISAYLTNHKINKGWEKNAQMRNVRFDRNMDLPQRNRDSVLKAVTKAITDKQLDIYKLDKKLNYVIVEMKDVDELFAKEFVEELMQNASEFYITYKSQKAKKNFDLVNKMTDSIKGLLYGNIETYAERNDLNINPLRQQLRTGSQKIQINAQANTALYTELIQQLGLSKIALQKETPLIQIIDSPMLPLKKEKPGRLMTGIKFAFIAFFFTSVFLIVSRWMRTEYQFSKIV